MMSLQKKTLKERQKRWDELFEAKKFRNVVRKFQPTEDSRKFVLESRFQLMEESLKKTKFDSPEFNAILDECVKIFMEMDENLKKLDHGTILKMTKDRLFKNEIIGQIDKHKIEQPKKDWPVMGRITLREAIRKSDIGQNPKAKESENVKKVFGGTTPVDSQPSPSSNHN